MSEPWKTLARGDPEEGREFSLFLGDECVAECDNRPFRSAEKTEPIVRRLMACWNACEGISTEDLEALDDYIILKAPRGGP
jgi:hypothetical protein